MCGTRDIAVKPLPGVTPGQARDVRARCWDFVFQCWQEKQKADEPAPEPDGCDYYKRLANKERRPA
jgi:hypothetical protein